MPVYEFACDQCGTVSDHRLPVEDRNEAQVCSRCGEPTRRILSYAVGHKMSKDALLSHPSLANDGVGHVQKRRNPTSVSMAR